MLLVGKHNTYRETGRENEFITVLEPFRNTIRPAQSDGVDAYARVGKFRVFDTISPSSLAPRQVRRYEEYEVRILMLE